ncbi:hypothetical protein PHET_01020 [Paragonimus heterotremus]|uniref:Uncharacterized protein n=1 Tax=Paragonimus heterotremus TaxID=100268 RepID=A0A8J4TS04_9TREM|nr:hypothetical protein PHET_01020 [Paragonimus heterotremus]
MLKPNVFSKGDIEFFLNSLSEHVTADCHLACSPISRSNIQFNGEGCFITVNGISDEIIDKQDGEKYMVLDSSNQYDAMISTSTLHYGEKWPPAEISTACFDWIDRSTLKSGITEESSDLLHDSLNTQLHGGQLRFSLTGSSHITEEELNQLHLTIADLEKQLAEKDSELADALCELRAQRAELVTSMNLYLEKLDELNEIRAENGKLKDTATEVERTHRFQRAELIKEADLLRDSLQNSENEFFLLKKELADTQRELHLVQTSAILREQETDAVSCKSEKLLSELVKLRSEERNLRKIITFEQSEREQIRHEYDNLMMRFTETVDNFNQMEKRLIAVNREIHAMISQLSRSRQSLFVSDEHWKTVRSRLLFLQNVISSSAVQSPEDDKPTELDEFSPIASQAACQHDEGVPNTELIEGSSLRKELDNSLIQLGPLSVNTVDFYGNHCFSLVTNASSFSTDRICSVNNECQGKSFIDSQGDTTSLGVLGVDKYKINSDQAHSPLNHQEHDFTETLIGQKPTTLMQNGTLSLCEETTELTRDIVTSNIKITHEFLAPFLQEICSVLKLPLSQVTERSPYYDEEIWHNITACVKRLHDRYIAAQAERSRLTALLSTLRNELKQLEVATQKEIQQTGSIRMQANNERGIAKCEYREIADNYGKSTKLIQQKADSARKKTKGSGVEREAGANILTQKALEFQQYNLGLVFAHGRLEELERQLFSVRSDLESASVERDGLLSRLAMFSGGSSMFPHKTEFFARFGVSPSLGHPVVIDGCSSFVSALPDQPSVLSVSRDLLSSVAGVENLDAGWSCAARMVYDRLRDLFRANFSPSSSGSILPDDFAMDVCSCLTGMSGRLQHAASVDNECNTLRAQLLDSNNKYEMISNELLSVQKALDSQTIELESFRSDCHLLAELILKLSISATAISDAPDCVSVNTSTLTNVLHHAKETVLTHPICRLTTSPSADTSMIPLSLMNASTGLAPSVQPMQRCSSAQFRVDFEEMNTSSRSAIYDLELADKLAVTFGALQNIPTTQVRKMPSRYLQLQRDIVNLRFELLTLRRETAEDVKSLQSDLGTLVHYANCCQSAMIKRQMIYFSLLRSMRDMICYVREIFAKLNMGNFLSEYDVESLNETTSVEDVNQLSEQLSMEFSLKLISITTRLGESDSLDAKTVPSYGLPSPSDVGVLSNVPRTDILSAFAYALAFLVNKDEADSIREFLSKNSTTETIMDTLNDLLHKVQLALDCVTSAQSATEIPGDTSRTKNNYAVLLEFIDQLAVVCEQPPVSSNRLDDVTLSTLLASLLTAIRQRLSIHVSASDYEIIKRLQDSLLGYIDDLAQTVGSPEQILSPTNIDLSTAGHTKFLSDTLRDLSLDPEPWLTRFERIRRILSALQLSDTRTQLMVKRVVDAFAEWTSSCHSHRYIDPSTTSEQLDLIQSALPDLKCATARITTRLLKLSDRLEMLQAQLHPCVKTIDSTPGNIQTETESYVIPALSDLNFSVSKLELKWVQLEASVSEFSHSLRSDLTSVQEEMGLMEAETAMERLCHEEVSSRLTEMMTHLLPPGSPASDSSSSQIYTSDMQALDNPVHTATAIPLRHFCCESEELLNMPSESEPVYSVKSVQHKGSSADLAAPVHLESRSILHSTERRVLPPVKSFEEIASVSTPRSHPSERRCSRRSHSLPIIHACIRDQTVNSILLSCLSKSTARLQGRQLREVNKTSLSQSFDNLSPTDGTLRRLSLQRFVNVLETYFPAFLMQSSSQFHSSLEHLVHPSTLRAGLRYLRHLLSVLPDHSFHTEPSILSEKLDTQIQLTELKLRQRLNQLRKELVCLQRKTNLEKSDDQVNEQQATRIPQLKQQLSQVICAYKCAHDLLPVRLPLHPGGPTCRTFNAKSSEKLLTSSIEFQLNTNQLSNRFDTLLRLLHLRDTEVLYLINKLYPESPSIQVESLERKLVEFNESWCNVTPVNLSSMPVCRIPINTFGLVSGAIPSSTQLKIRLHADDPKTSHCVKGDHNVLSVKSSIQGARTKEADDWPTYENHPSSSTQKSTTVRSKAIAYLIKQSKLLLKRLGSGVDSQAVTLIEDDLDHFVQSLADFVRQLRVTASASADSMHPITLAQNAPPLPTSPGYPRRSVRPSISDLIDALELQLDTNWCLRQRLNAANLQLDQVSKLLHKGHHSYAYLEERLGVETDKHTALTEQCDVARQQSRKTSQILDSLRGRQEQRLTQLSPPANDEMRIESAPTLVGSTCAAPRIALKSIHSAGDVLRTGGTDSHTPAVVEYTRLITHSTVTTTPLKISVSSQTTKSSSKLSCLSRSALNCAPHRKRSPSDTTPTRIYARPHGITTSNARRRPTATTASATLPSTVATSSKHPVYFQSNNNSVDEVRVTESSSVPIYPSDASVCDEHQRLLSGWSDATTLQTDDTQLTESSILSLPSSVYSGTHSEPTRSKSPKKQKKRKRLFKLIGDRLSLTKRSSRPK